MKALESHPYDSANKPAKRLTKFYPWLVILFCSSFLFYKYILQVSPSVMTDELMRFFHVNGAGLGNLAATFFYAYLVTQLFVGPLLDKYCPRLLISGAIAVSAFGIFLFASAQTLMLASLGRALIGVGAAFATVGYMKMAAVWFKPQQFAFVGGLLATAAMVGSMAGQTPLALLVIKFGWRQSLFYCGFLGLFLAVMFYLFVRNNKQPTFVLESKQVETKLKLRDFMQVLKSKANWYLMLYSGLAFSPVAVFGGLWGNPFLQEAYNLSRADAASLTSMMFLGLAVGGPVLGMVSDRLGKRFGVMLVGVLLSLVSLSTVIYAPNLSPWQIGLGLFLFGFGTGAFMLGFAFGKETNPIALAATVVGLINTGDALFGAVTEPMVGKVLDMFWHGKVVNGVHYFNLQDFHLALSLLPFYLALALVFLLLLKKTFKKEVKSDV